MTAIRLDKLLKNSSPGGLKNIVQNAQIMQELTSALRKAVAEELGQALLSANLREDGQLVVVASSPAWAAKLRFEEASLLAAAREAGRAATSLKVSVSRRG